MIFLGAGASKVFGLKTMQDLTDDLVRKMREKKYGKTINEILKAVKIFGLTPDFENVYTTLEALVDPREGIRKSGPFTAYIAWRLRRSGSKMYPTKHPKFKDVLTDFRDLIYEECSIPRGTVKNNRRVFDEFFRIMREQKENRVLSSRVGRMETREVNIGDTIATTNYDMAVELYHNLAETEFADGFKATRNEYVRELDFQEYGRHPTSRWLIKLHGSIWQFKQEEEKIIKTNNVPDALPLEISVGEQMMIYPVGEKPILQEPYYSFHSIFKEQPWNVLVTIGYSFRDEPVNIAVLERLATPLARLERLSDQPPSIPKVIVVNPDAEKVIRNLGQKISGVNERIIRINEPFQDNHELFRKIRIALESSGWNEYKMKTHPRGY